MLCNVNTNPFGDITLFGRIGMGKNAFSSNTLLASYLWGWGP
jgi:hypothetical protein